MRLRLGVIAAVTIAALASAGTGVTLARYTDTASVGSNTFTTATLQPPTGLGASAGCNLVNPKVTLTWTATTSTYADGYDVYRSTTNGGPYSSIAHVTGRATTTYTDTSVNLNKTYYYVLKSTAFSWTSANSGQASTTTPLICL